MLVVLAYGSSDCLGHQDILDTDLGTGLKHRCRYSSRQLGNRNVYPSRGSAAPSGDLPTGKDGSCLCLGSSSNHSNRSPAGVLASLYLHFEHS